MLSDALIWASLSCTLKGTYVLIVGGHVGAVDHLQIDSDKIDVVLLLGSIPGQMIDVHNAFVKFASEFDVEGIAERDLEIVLVQKLSEGGSPCWCQVRYANVWVFQERR